MTTQQCTEYLQYLNESPNPNTIDSKKENLLVVILHGWTGKPKIRRFCGIKINGMEDLENAVRETYKDEYNIDCFIPCLPYYKFFGTEPASTIVDNLLENMDSICEEKKYSRIILIGYSLGAVIARRLFLSATDIATIVHDTNIKNARHRDWSQNVERIISIAGLSRGWLNSGRWSITQSFVGNFFGMIGHLHPETKPTIFDVRRGAPFIVQTRLQWLALHQTDKHKPLFVQLLGTQDDLVAPDDAIDFGVNTGDNEDLSYFYIQLKYTQHSNSTDFQGEKGKARKELFQDALRKNAKQLKEKAIPKKHFDTLPPEPDKLINHVVFIIHGIRDEGYWTRKIAQKIHETAEKKGEKFYCLTPSYGYFAMLPFIKPWIRQQKVEWLMNEYVEARARFPNAKFSYVGHSNGTYLVARALEYYPAVSFHNVFFAGSVVRRNYDWPNSRVQKIVNMVATKDWVVAIFPQGLEPFKKFFDLGGAGFGGFDELNTPEQVEYVDGKHSAGVLEGQWSKIAEFIVNDEIPTFDGLKEVQSCFWKFVSKISTVLLLLTLFILIIKFPAWILSPIFIPETTAITAAAHTFGAVLYFMFLYFIVTRL